MRSRFQIINALSVCLTCVSAVSATEEPGFVGLPIGTIEIVNHEVFDEPATGVSAPYRIANTVHIRTRDEVVGRELLFETGDLFDQELVEQTERNLRGLSFIRDARIDTIAVDLDSDGEPDQVDMRVLTWDTWSLSPRVDFRQVHDRTIWELGVSEKNLFGRGKSITATHRTNLDRTIDRVSYADPQLVGSNVSLLVSASHLSDGDEQLLMFDRGYLSLRDPWSWTVGGGSFSRTDPIFKDGSEIGRLYHRGQWGDFQVSRAVQRSARRALSVHGAFRLREERVGSEMRDFGVAEFGIRSIGHRYVRLTHVNQFERSEDFNLGTDTFATVGLSAPELGGSSERAAFVSAGHIQGIAFGDEHFLIAEARFDGRREHHEWRNALTTLRGRYLLKHAERRATIGRVAYQRGHNLDQEVQLLLGAETGLRGYPVRQFSGNRSMLMTLEERWFFADDVAQLGSLGLAGFVDMGFVWSEQQVFTLRDLKTSIGMSLLLGSNRLSSRGGIRLDFGYGLNQIANVGRWVFAAGSDIAF